MFLRGFYQVGLFLGEYEVKQVVIENPILNSPFEEPRRHWRFTDEGITNEIVEDRRISSYFVPIAKPKKRGKDRQLAFDTEWTKDRIEENKFINQVRGRVILWREGGYVQVTKTTRRLLDKSSTRQQAIFLPDRSFGNRNLHNRGSREVW